MRIFRHQIAKPWMERNTLLTRCSWISEGIWSDVTQKLKKKKHERDQSPLTCTENLSGFTKSIYCYTVNAKEIYKSKRLTAMRGLYANASLCSSLTLFYSQRISAGLFIIKGSEMGFTTWTWHDKCAMEIWGADRRVTILLYLCWILAVFWECFRFVPHWIIS